MLALDLLHQRRERGFHGAEHDHRFLGVGRVLEQVRVVVSSTHSIIGQAITGKARHEVHRLPPHAEAGDLVVRVGDDAARLAGTRPCSAGGCCRAGPARRACPAPARCPACARGSALRPAGCSSSGTPSAAAAHWRVWSSGVAPMPPQENTTSPEAKARAQRGGDALGSIAHVLGPGQLQAARGQQLDHLGHVLVGALAREDFVADDDRGRNAGVFRVRACGWSSAAPAMDGHAGGRRDRRDGRRQAQAAGAAFGAQLLQRRQAVVREPQRREGEDQGVDPDRQRHQDRRTRQRTARPRPTRCWARRPGSRRARRCPAAQPRWRRKISRRSSRAGVLGQRVESHHAVGQPAPDQRRQDQNQAAASATAGCETTSAISGQQRGAQRPERC